MPTMASGGSGRSSSGAASVSRSSAWRAPRTTPGRPPRTRRPMPSARRVRRGRSAARRRPRGGRGGGASSARCRSSRASRSPVARFGLDRHDGHAVLGEEVELRVGGPRVADDRAVHAEVGQLGAGANGRRDEQPVIARERRGRGPAREAHVVLEARLAAAVVGGIDRGQDERERRGAGGAQGPGGPARSVAHPLGHLADVRGGGDADRPAPVERERHRRGRHAGLGGHVADRRAHGLHPRHGTAGTTWHRDVDALTVDAAGET